jgi:hypothetical protein
LSAPNFVHVHRLADAFDLRCAKRPQNKVAFAKLAGGFGTRDRTDRDTVSNGGARFVLMPNPSVLDVTRASLD